MSMIRDLYDNAMAENFFSILKCECIYRRKPQTRAQARKMIDEFIWFYNHVRLQTATGMPPLQKRTLAHACPFPDPLVLFTNFGAVRSQYRVAFFVLGMNQLSLPL